MSVTDYYIYIYFTIVSVTDDHIYFTVVSVTDYHIYLTIVSVTDYHIYLTNVSVTGYHIYFTILSSRLSPLLSQSQIIYKERRQLSGRAPDS